MNKVAVIDLGTNTFHLLIAEVFDDKSYRIILKKQIPVMLAKEGIKDGSLPNSALIRAQKAINSIGSVLQKHQIKKINAIGTSALRTACNSDVIVNYFKKSIHSELKIIKGSEEAQLIYHGVKQSVNFDNNTVLILDIGGGSIELILCNKNEIIKAESFEIGAARLMNQFDNKNNISEKSIKELKSYIANQIDAFLNTCTKYQLTDLIGASGVFDTLTALDVFKKGIDPNLFTNQKNYRLSLEDFLNIYHSIIKNSKDEIKSIPVVADFRADMMHVSVILVEYIIKNTGIKNIICSEFAIKEGYLWTIINETKNI